MRLFSFQIRGMWFRIKYIGVICPEFPDFVSGHTFEGVLIN